MSHDPVGYYHDYAIYHPACLPEGVDPDGEEVGAIFNWDANACTSICDRCSQPLLECDCDQDEDA